MHRLATRGKAPVWCVVLALVIVAPGCLSRSFPQKQRYVLELARPGGVVAGPRFGVLRVGRVRVSPLFERKGFVYRRGDGTYATDFYNEFYAPPGVLIERAAIDWLEGSSLFEDVVEGNSRAEADYLLEGSVTKLFADVADEALPVAVMEATLVLRDAKTPKYDVIVEGEYRADVIVASESPEAIGAAWNEALGRVLAALETELRRSLTLR